MIPKLIYFPWIYISLMDISIFNVNLYPIEMITMFQQTLTQFINNSKKF